jgi:hypothetical protein
VGAGWTAVWLLVQLREWWLPYLLGPTPLHCDFRWYWEGGYGETLRLLSAREGRPVPDLEHLVLQLLSLAAALLTVRAAVRLWSRATAAA